MAAEKLKRGLKARHLSMISIGGVIGVGMFLGSGATVKLAGPGVVLSYALGGVIMLLVMFALAEMSVAKPVPGSFRVYASEALHPYVGFAIGWIYALSWVSVMSAEIVAANIYMSLWFPASYSWVFGLIFAILMTVVNLRSVASFGEFEFWFAMIKVVAIVVFIVLGLALILGVGARPIGLKNYIGAGGFLPRGLSGVLLAMVMVMVAYGGTEVIGIAAGETQDPEHDVPRAINGIIVRTLVLYIGSIAILVGVIPWSRVGLGGSPFVLVYRLLGIPGAADLMNFVVITAALSSMNSGLYTSSRMLYSLGKSGFGPAFLTRVNPRTNVPTYAVLASTLFLYVGVLVYYLSPRRAFLYITGISAFGFILTWLVISLTHVYYRPKILAESPERLKFRMPGYPWASWAAVALLAAVMVTLWFIPEQRIGIYSGVALLAALSVYYFTVRARQAARARVERPGRVLEVPARAEGPVIAGAPAMVQAPTMANGPEEAGEPEGLAEPGRRREPEQTEPEPAGLELATFFGLTPRMKRMIEEERGEGGDGGEKNR
ncbi:MAG: amino acid permease [Firmicutes bacterium]|nr:amino acid permease [Bacillota bacterium]